jgi:hypothetical protein
LFKKKQHQKHKVLDAEYFKLINFYSLMNF